MKICMIGTGYVGLVSGACFADLGNTVWCVDKNQKKINILKNGKSPIFEPGLDEIVKKNFQAKILKFTTVLETAGKRSDIIFICVGTPTKKESSSADLRQVYNVAKEIAKSIGSGGGGPSHFGTAGFNDIKLYKKAYKNILDYLEKLDV